MTPYTGVNLHVLALTATALRTWSNHENPFDQEADVTLPPTHNLDERPLMISESLDGELLRRLRKLGVSEHLDVCEIPSALVHSWPQISSNRIIITGERRVHYLARHPELMDLESALLLTLREPDLIQSSLNDGRVAYLHIRIDRRYFLRATLLISTQQGLHNSLLSAWKIRTQRVEARNDVVIWRRR